jgi:hypothetical protein
MPIPSEHCRVSSIWNQKAIPQRTRLGFDRLSTLIAADLAAMNLFAADEIRVKAFVPSLR